MQGEQKGRTPLCAASDAGKLKAVKRLLVAEAKVDVEDAAKGKPGCQGGKPPCKQAKRVRPEGGCGVIPMEIFFDFFIFSPKK